MKNMYMALTVCVAVAGVSAAALGSPLALCGFDSGEDAPAYAIGEVNGQGSATGGWAGAWASNTTGVFMVADGGGANQHLSMYGGTSGSHHTDRMMNAWSGDFVMEFSLRLSDNADGQRDQTQIQFKNASGQRPLNIKIGSSGYPMFLVNDQAMIVQSGDDLHPNMIPLGTAEENWARIAVVCDWDTATFDLYWEQTDGSMKLVNTKVGWKDTSFSGEVVEIEIYSPKAYGNMNAGMDVDNISLVPEPATLALLAVSGLFLARRRRSPIGN